MVGHGEKFGRKKEQAIAALLSQNRIEDAARLAGIGVSTLRRWLRMPEFQAEYLQARRDAVHQANARIQHHSGAAATVLLKLMANSDTPASVRVRAAEIVLNQATKTMESEDLEARFAALERASRPSCEAAKANGLQPDTLSRPVLQLVSEANR